MENKYQKGMWTPQQQIYNCPCLKIADQLHGTCFYAGEDPPYYDKVLKRTVREILELTSFWDGQEESDREE